jgi:hypothetical protein
LSVAAAAAANLSALVSYVHVPITVSPAAGTSVSVGFKHMRHLSTPLTLLALAMPPRQTLQSGEHVQVEGPFTAIERSLLSAHPLTTLPIY